MSNLPIDLILIRHGESERNLIGKNNEIEFDEKEYKSIHSSKFRLTEEGKKQSIITGKYIKENSYWKSYNINTLVNELNESNKKNLTNSFDEIKKIYIDLSNKYQSSKEKNYIPLK